MLISNKSSVIYPFYRQAKGGLSCFDSIKKDPYCINELNSFTTEEQSLQRLISLQCGCKGNDVNLTTFIAKLTVFLNNLHMQPLFQAQMPLQVF